MNEKKNPRRHSIMRHSYQTGQQKYFADQSAYEQTQSALDNYYPREALDENSFEIYPELDGKYRDYTETEKSFLNKVGNFLFGDSPASFGERFTVSFNPINIWNDWHLKRVGADRTAKEFAVEEANYKLSELEDIERYSNLIKERQSLNEAIRNGKISADEAQDRLIDIQNDISELNAYFQTEGKKSNIVTDLLYNTNKIDWSDANDLDLKLDILGQDFGWNKNKPLGAGERFGEWTSNLIKSGADALLSLGDFISRKPSDRFTKRAIQNSSASNRLYDRLFVDYSKNPSDLDILNLRIKDWKDFLQRDLLEKIAESIETENAYTQGSWYFDPRLIDPRYRSIQEQTKTGFLGWMDPTKFALMIPETGSSWSDTKNFIGLMAVNYGAEAVGALATTALTKNPETALATLTGIRATAAGATLGLTAAMRRHETNSEAMDALSNKVLTESIKNGVDIQSVLNRTKDYTKAIGINTDGLTELELLLLALAYNVPTDDPTFEKIKRDSRKGLSKVINENNALAAIDYLEALPFMSFTGSFFREAASAFKPNKLRTVDIYKSRGDGFYDYSKPIGRYQVLDRKQLAEHRIEQIAAKDKNFAKAIDASFNGVLDRAITRVADKFGKDIESKLKWSHGLKFLKRKAQQLVPLATKEGIEEGQQQLLQSRYQRGEYEYYDKPTSMFDLPSLFNTPLLASDAVAAYFGINFGDPDNGDEELRKAMEIGAISGALFRAGHIASNLVSDKNAKYAAWIPGFDIGDRDNTRNLMNLLRNDTALRLIVGESLGKYEDDQHVGIFFDAFSKRGITSERLANSLNELKNFKGDLVTDDYIDEDIRLMNVAWNAYKNPELNAILKDLNITKDGEEHKDLIKLATRAVIDYQNVKKLLNQNDEQLNSFIDEILLASEDTEGKDSGEVDYITSKRNSSLDAILRKIDESFESVANLVNQEKQAFVSSQEAASQAQEAISKRKEKIATDTENTGGFVITAEEISKEILKIADEQFSIPSKQQYRRNRLTTFFNLSRIRNSEIVRDMLKLQQQRLTLLRNETGTDIDVDRLIGMIDVLNQEIGRMKSKATESMSDINELIRKQNEIREKLNKSLKKKDRLPLLKEQTLEDVFAGYPQFENQAEIDEQLKLRALNNAVLLVLKPIADAYVTGRTNPALVKQTQRPLNWSELSDSQRNEYKNKLIDEWLLNGKGVPTDNQIRMQYLNEQKAKKKKFNELQKKFEKLVKELQSTPEEDRTFEMDAAIDEVSRQAAQQLILFDLAQKAERRKVAHRQWQLDSPITPADTEAAMNGNEEAQRKINDALNKIKKDETEDVIQAQNSLDEQPSDSFVGDSKVDVDVFQPEDGELGEALSEIMVDNAPETDAEKEAYKKLYGALPEKKKKENKNNLELDAKPLSNDSEPLLPDQDDSTESSLSDTVGSMPESTNIEILDENLNLNSEIIDEPYQNLIDKDPIDSNDILKEAGINTANTIDVDPSLNETELDSDEDGDNGSSREEGDDNISEKNKNADQEEPLQEDLPAGNFPIDENEDGNLVINDMVISDEVAEELIEEQDLLSMFGLSMNLDSNDFYANPESDDPRQIRSSERAWTDYISQTFFYGYQEDVPPVLKANGQELKLNKPLRPGKELSKKLSQNGWFKSTKKYYVVCGGIESDSSHNANDLTVALILEDSEACYATFLRTPDSIVQKQPNGVRMSGLEYIKSRLRFIGVDVEKYRNAILDARELYYHNHKVRQPIDTGRIDQDELLRQIKKWQRDARKYYEELSLDNPELAKEKRLIEYDARRRAKIGVGDPLTEEQIQELIDNLIEARNKIISAYCIKQQDGTYVVPTKNGYALTHVHPENPRISNGKFNTNPRTNGLPTFKKLTGKDGGFGLSEDLEELTKQLNDRDVEFGYGTGRNGENPYAIVDFIGGDGSIQYDGIGHSGKIYVMIEGPDGAKVPVMLREERFNRQEGLGFIHRQKDNLVLAIDPATGKMLPEKGLPSAAEVILYMITGKLNVDHMPAGYADVMKPLVDLFVHNGEDTLTTIDGNKQSLLNKFKFFADKRFAWLPFGKKEQYRLAIVVKNKSGDRILKYYTAEDLFGANSEEVRREVVYTIAENMHWNTEKADMKEKMNPKILDALRTYFNTYKDATEFRICGLEQFSFKKSDLFELDKKGNIKRSKDISVFAWMLSNGKILTDLLPDHFKDPFVFANGVKVDEDVNTKNIIEQNQPRVHEEVKIDPRIKVRKNGTINVWYGNAETRENEIFSNLHKRPFSIKIFEGEDSITFKTVEHAFLYIKFRLLALYLGFEETKKFLLSDQKLTGEDWKDNVKRWIRRGGKADSLKNKNGIASNIGEGLEEEIAYILQHISKILAAKTGAEAKYLGGENGGYPIIGHSGDTFLNTIWDSGELVALDVMEHLIRESFTQNPEDLKILKSTGDIPITHLQGRTWKEEFPRILMEIRSSAERPNSIIDATATIAAKQEEIERFKSRFGVRSKDAEALVAKSEENRQAILEQYNVSPGVQKHGGMRDVVVLDINSSEIKSTNQSERASKLKEQLNSALSKYIKYLSENGVQVAIENIIISSDATSPQILKQVINNKIVPVLSMYNDGTGNVRLIQASELLGTVRGVTGVFSKIKTGGKLDQKRARTWLKNVLGLDDSQVIIENGVWKSASDELVYGITNVAANVISDQFEGVIRLSKQGGRGVHYHEAWHYINLLLHSPKERAYIYRKYVESRPKLKKATFKEIEEAMAEDFRKYMEMKNEYNISNILRRVGNAILNFINTFRGKQNEIQYIYESIRSGMYAKSTLLDDDSLNEFKRRFPNGVYQASYVIPGVPGHVIEKLTNITNPATFYQVGQSLAHKLIDRYDLKTIGDIKSVLSGLFRLFIEDLRLQNENDGNPLIDDIINNPEAFKHIIYSMFKQYGIEPKFKRIKVVDVTSTNPENDSEDAQKAEDRAENVWDIDNLLISLKDNVAFRAKLFLSRQKKTHFAWDENGLRYLEEDYDTLLNTPMYLGYSETWVTILQNLWNIESFDNRSKDGNFESSSMRGMVKRLALSLPFFAELDRRLDTLYNDEGNPDVELINQIYCTVKKSNPQVAFFELRDAIEKNSYFGMGDMLLEGEQMSKSTGKNKADRNKEWALLNSNALRAVRNLPRLWSKTAMVSGMVTVNDKGETVVNLKFVDALYEVLDNGEIWDYITKPKRKKSNGKYPTTLDEMEDVYENVSNAIVKVLNLMGISSDREVFDYYIQKHLQNPNDFGNPEKRFQVLCQVLAKPSGQNAGSIRSILALLDDSVGYSEIQMSKGKTKPVDQVYYGYKIDSEISKYAEAYNEIYPSASDFSVVGPDGSTIYPISENNHMSDELRGLNYDTNGKIESMQRSPYCLNSLILKLASEINHKNPTKDEMFKLNAFVGLKDSEKQRGKDYFGITPLEDYIAKMEMTFRNMIVLPTMADKKTWYAIEQKDIVLPHDLITYDQNSENGAYLARRFSNRTLNIFAGYFIDELNSLEQYYSRENILYLVNNPTKAVVNFHGAIKDGRMTFDGNGGKFRYFYEIQFMLLDYSGNGPQRYINLNQYLEFMYNKQKEIENDPVSYGGLALLREQNNTDDELDGFELVRLAIKEIRSKFLSDTEESKKLLYDNINSWLMNLVDQEVYAVAQDGDLQIGLYKLTQNNIIKFASTAIPRHILDYYSKEFQKAGLFAGRMRPYYAQQYDYDFTLSAIANHVASTMISIIETEKIFTGDPAYYKWKNIDKKSKYAKMRVSIDGFVTTVSNLREKHSDKIKRLGAVLSPGANLRTQYSEEEMNNIYGIKGSKYTVMNISDITAKSLYIGELKRSFGRQALVDYVRQNPPAWWNKYVEDSGKKEGAVISSLYRDDSEYEKLKDYAELHDAEFAALLAERTNMAIAPYNYDKSIGHKGITVSDAEVIIRPALYRKIRISLGEWTFTPDEDGYSDEEAYNIIESDPNWMYDEEKYKKVSKLELYPLKMTYFANGSRVISYNEDTDVVNYLNVPVYNKMAIFPAFKFAFSSDTGKALYDRMNMSGNEIDMIAFESAVKVGDNLGKWSPFEDGVDNLDKLNDGLNSRSNQYIKDGEVLTNVAEDGEDLLPILIQDLNGLRLQLNTESHTATERGLGTQAFKIMFSNIVDEDDYGNNKTDENGNLKATRKGRLIKEDIMSCIHALTVLGVASIQKEFYDSSGKLKPQVVQNWVQQIAKNNGLGISAEEILSDGVVASLMSRKVFENGVSSLVNKEIVDINTTGGTAVQQSVFGFVGYGKRNVVSDEYYVRNNGENLKWNKYDGSMEVILSLNFFRHVVPIEFQSTPDRMRQWLINHDVIKGIKKSISLFKIGDEEYDDIDPEYENGIVYSKPKPFGIGYRIPTQGMSSTFSFTVADVLPQQSGDVIIVPMEFTAQTGSDKRQCSNFKKSL